MSELSLDEYRRSPRLVDQVLIEYQCELDLVVGPRFRTDLWFYEAGWSGSMWIVVLDVVWAGVGGRAFWRIIGSTSGGRLCVGSLGELGVGLQEWVVGDLKFRCFDLVDPGCFDGLEGYLGELIS